MQSSSMNCWAVRLRTATHSPTPSRRGLRGTWPVSARPRLFSAAVDKAERPEPRLRLALAPAAEREAHRRADAAREDEAEDERPGRRDREVPAQLAADVGGLADPLAQLVHGARELVSLGLDLEPDFLRCAAVTRRHRLSGRQRSASLPGSPAQGRAAFPS